MKGEGPAADGNVANRKTPDVGLSHAPPRHPQTFPINGDPSSSTAATIPVLIFSNKSSPAYTVERSKVFCSLPHPQR